MSCKVTYNAMVLMALLFLAACNNGPKEEEGVKPAYLKQTGLVVDVPAHVTLNQPARIKLFFADKKYTLLRACVNCVADSVKVVSDDKMSGCTQKLPKNGDTIIIDTKPSKMGTYRFPKITYVFKDAENHYYVADTVCRMEVNLNNSKVLVPVGN